jgi:hypothetical protein
MNYENKLKTLGFKNLYKLKDYTYSYCDGKIREHDDLYFFEFSINDIIKEKYPEKIDCSFQQSSNIEEDELKVIIKRSFLRTKKYFKENQELFI